MLFVTLFVLSLVAGGLALVVFVASLPWLLRPMLKSNRFGLQSKTQSVGQAIGSGLMRTFDFRGRANPMDFWFFAVFVCFICCLSAAATILLAYLERDSPTWLSALPLLIIVILALPSLSLAVRRLHDINRSGMWLLLLLVFGYFILLYWFFQPSQAEGEVAEIFA